MLFFVAVMAAVCLQRFCELMLAARNARYVRARGGVEVGASHYKYIVLLHLCFFVSLVTEVVATGSAFALPPWWAYCFGLFLAAQLLRYWCILSLGKRWNTRILVIPGEEPLRRGPYRLLRHPNYVVVAIELFTLPLTFSAVHTAIAFTLLNAWLLLRVRIPLEEKSVYEGEESP
ncbi:isoprenylcysteine carboxyl methyltransferase family protein [Brevibacillus sp. SAFN-007a]|uniref:isoprenylcysteine carboxyl methyltransferase family protein n=1 Tax=Brevibacillus sp. SAFN-007a TaxID=3436862 RepID=UPI003F7EF51D